jgi:hypothetical protein
MKYKPNCTPIQSKKATRKSLRRRKLPERYEGYLPEPTKPTVTETIVTTTTVKTNTVLSLMCNRDCSYESPSCCRTASTESNTDGLFDAFGGLCSRTASIESNDDDLFDAFGGLCSRTGSNTSYASKYSVTSVSSVNWPPFTDVQFDQTSFKW